MQTIHKKVLEMTSQQSVSLPVAAKIISVGNQNENLCLWYITNTQIEDSETVVVHIIGTGRELKIDKPVKFIGTVLMMGGQLVWHVFVEEQSQTLVF